MSKLNLPDRIVAHDSAWKELFREVQQSDLWKAIQEFIEKSPAFGCGLINKTGTLYYHRGCGAFHLKHIYAYPAGAGAKWKETFRFCFEVYLYDEDRDGCEGSHSEYCMVDAPVALLLKFDQTEFDKWVTQENAEFRKRKLARAREDLAKLLTAFPELRTRR